MKEFDHKEKILLELVSRHAWQPYRMGNMLFEQYRERFQWLHEHLDRPFPDHESTDFPDSYRWTAVPVRNRMGLIDDVVVAFRDPADCTMFVLRWA